MAEAQIIRTENGEELVVLTRAEFEALKARVQEVEDAEDAEDVAIFDSRMAEIAEAGDTPMPAELSALILKGNGLLKAMRVWRGMSQAALAAKAGVGQSYLSAIETKRRPGTHKTMMKLAAALDVPVTWLI